MGKGLERGREGGWEGGEENIYSAGWSVRGASPGEGESGKKVNSMSLLDQPPNLAESLSCPIVGV